MINKEPTMLPLLIILDEFAAIGSFEMLKRAVVIARSACMRFLFILQNREQLDEHYEKDGAKAFFANATLCSFSPDSYEEQKYISERIGNKTIFVKSKSVANGKASITTSSQSRPVMTHDEVACSTKLFLFSRYNRPALIEHITFYKDSRFRNQK